MGDLGRGSRFGRGKPAVPGLASGTRFKEQNRSTCRSRIRPSGGGGKVGGSVQCTGKPKTQSARMGAEALVCGCVVVFPVCLHTSVLVCATSVWVCEATPATPEASLTAARARHICIPPSLPLRHLEPSGRSQRPQL